MSIRSEQERESGRYWCFVIYPDSCPNWKDLLDNSMLDMCYIVHDKDKVQDLSEEEVTRHQGDERKIHVHVLLAWNNTTTLSNVRKIVKKLGAANGYVEKCLSVKNYYEYMIHKKKPNKYQYSKDERIELNGFDVGAYIQLSAKDEQIIKKQIFNYIKSERVFYYCDLSDTIYDSDDSMLIYVFGKYTGEFDKYIKSMCFKALNRNKFTAISDIESLLG